MSEEYLFMLLLCLATVAAYLLSSVELVIKSMEEPTGEHHKGLHGKKAVYIHKHREMFKLGIMLFKNILRVAIGYSLFMLMYISAFAVQYGVEVAFVLSSIVTVAVYVLFIYLLPNVSFHSLRNATIGWLYYPTLIVVWLMYPFAKIVLVIRNTTYSGQLHHGEKPISIEELSDAVEIVTKVNTIEEKRILSGMVRFANAFVEDIMCHRTEIVMIDYGATFAEVKALFLESGFSRIPVFRGNSDNIVGVIHLKDIIHNIEEDGYRWHEDIHPPLFASDELAVNKLLLIFQSKKEHMAIVADEYGSTLGLVTLEDVLEEIVGEINDEFDEEEEDAPRQLQDGAYIIDGKTPVGEFVDMLGSDDDILDLIPEETDTVAGLIVELLQDFPKVGSSVLFNNEFRITVISLDRHRIDKVRVEKSTEANDK